MWCDCEDPAARVGPRRGPRPEQRRLTILSKLYSQPSTVAKSGVQAIEGNGVALRIALGLGVALGYQAAPQILFPLSPLPSSHVTSCACVFFRYSRLCGEVQLALAVGVGMSCKGTVMLRLCVVRRIMGSLVRLVGDAAVRSPPPCDSGSRICEACASSTPAATSPLLSTILSLIPDKGIAVFELARRLPDAAMEQIDGGLKGFLYRHADVFTVSSESGVLTVCPVRAAKAPSESVEEARRPMVSSLLRYADLTGKLVPSHTSVAPPPPWASNTDPLLSFSRSALKTVCFSVRSVPEYLVPVSAIAARRVQNEEACLAELRRVHAAGVVDLVAAGSEWYCAVLAPYRSLVREGVNIAMEPHRVQEYDAYRLARFLQVREYTPLDVLVDRARDAVQRPVLIILLSYPTLFEFESPELKAVRFALSQILTTQHQLSGRALPSLLAEVDQLASEYRFIHKKDIERIGNKKRLRVLMRALAALLHPTPYADSKVAAYALYDVLPNSPIDAYTCGTYLSREAQKSCVIDVKFLFRFPNLFFVFQPNPPAWLVQRADLPRPKIKTAEEFTREELLLSILCGCSTLVEGRPITGATLWRNITLECRKRIESEGGIIKFIRQFPEHFTAVEREDRPCEAFVLNPKPKVDEPTLASAPSKKTQEGEEEDGEQHEEGESEEQDDKA